MRANTSRVARKIKIRVVADIAEVTTVTRKAAEWKCQVRALPGKAAE
jgi:hypothetical protein